MNKQKRAITIDSPLFHPGIFIQHPLSAIFYVLN